MKVYIENLQELQELMENFLKDQQSLINNIVYMRFMAHAFRSAASVLMRSDEQWEQQDADDFKELANVFYILGHNLTEDDPMKAIVDEIHNDVMSMRQWILGELGLDTHVYNSETNIKRATAAFNKVVDKFEPGQELEFIEVE